MIAEIPVRGGPGIIGGDGLELDGRTLYNVRGSGPGRGLRPERCARVTASGRARARRPHRPRLDVPSTATLVGRTLWAVNARFGVACTRERALLDHPAAHPSLSRRTGMPRGRVGHAAYRRLWTGLRPWRRPGLVPGASPVSTSTAAPLNCAAYSSA